MPYATALAGAFPRLAPAANLLPPEDRRYGSRVMWVPTVALALVLAAILGGAAAWSKVGERRYLDRVHAEIATLTPRQQRAANLGREPPTRWCALSFSTSTAPRRAAIWSFFANSRD